MAKLAAQIEHINQVSAMARTSWIVLLGYLAFVGVTLLAVQDADFFVPTRQTQLPLVDVAIPTASFFVFAPILAAALYIYLHIILLKLWDAIADVREPEIDGQPIGDAILPWLVNDWALSIKGGAFVPARPLRALGNLASFLLIWAAAPLVLFGFWWWSMPAHRSGLTLLLAGCFLVALSAGVTSWQTAYAWLTGHRDGRRERPWLWSAGAFLSAFGGWRMGRARVGDLIRATRDRRWRSADVWYLGILLASVTLLRTVWPFEAGSVSTLASADVTGVEMVALPDGWRDWETARAAFRETWCRREGLEMAVCGQPAGPGRAVSAATSHDRTNWCAEHGIGAGQPCTAAFAEVDERFQTEWRDERRRTIDELPKLDLAGRDLRLAIGQNAVIAGANLGLARLEGANFIGARLEGANIGGARLEGANLGGARLEGANLGEARLEGADLGAARLEGANLRESRLEGADLGGARLEGADLGAARLEGANLIGARLEGANLFVARLEGADLGGARLEGANLGGARLEGANLGAARLEGANLGAARLEGANLIGARLEGANLGAARLEGANLREARLEGANLGAARLEGANLVEARLEGANLRAARLVGANLSEARLEGANLRRARLEGADLGEARLEGANLRRARLEGANLGAARLEGANLGGARLEGANLGGARLEGANLGAARLEGANLHSADFRESNWAGASHRASPAQFADFRGAQELRQAQLEDLIGNEGTLLPDGPSDTGQPWYVWSCWETPHPDLERIVATAAGPEADDAQRAGLRANLICSSDNPRRKTGTPLPLDAPYPERHPLAGNADGR